MNQEVRAPRLPDARYIRMPVSELTTPREGRVCFLDRWWAVHLDSESVLFFKSYRSPQCNRDRRFFEVNPIACTSPMFIPVAYVPDIGD